MTSVAAVALAAATGQAAVVADFDDGTTGDLDTNVDISIRRITDANIVVTNKAHGLPDADMELYINYCYGSPGNDRAVIDTDTTFSDVIVSDVMGLNGDGYNLGGGGVAAGVPAGGGGGYLLYLAANWTNGDGTFWDSSLGGSYQLVLARMAVGTDYPLSAPNPYDAVEVTGFLMDTPNFVRLTVNGTSITGEAWLGVETPAGAADCTVGLTDASPLSGHVGTYFGGRNVQTSWRDSEVGLDDFHADVIPEPATMALFSLGAAAVIAVRRRRR